MKKVFGGITAQVNLQVQGRTPTLINRNLMPGDLVSNGYCYGQCSCDCHGGFCRPSDAIRTR